MNRAYQTIANAKIGNCEQAVLASLFDLKIEQVVPLIEYGEQRNEARSDWLKHTKGLQMSNSFFNPNTSTNNFFKSATMFW